MSASAAEPPTSDSMDLVPREIRAALVPEEAADFDREYRQAMREATETLDLTGVLDLLRRWRRVAWSTRDSAAHRRMLDHAERLTSGDEVATEPWSVTKARLGL